MNDAPICPTCHGTGKGNTTSGDCPSCQGSGRVLRGHATPMYPPYIPPPKDDAETAELRGMVKVLQDEIREVNKRVLRLELNASLLTSTPPLGRLTP